MRIVFFGTPDIAVSSLVALARTHHTLCAVVTKPPTYDTKQKSLIESPVSQQAHMLGLSVHAFERPDDVRETLTNLHADCAVVFAFGAILPSWILELFPKGVVNVHPSLLPLYRGPSPLQAVLLAGETETGISIISMDEKMDHGPIYRQEVISLDPGETHVSLQEKIASHAPALIVATIDDIERDHALPTPQDHERATVCKLIKKEYGEVHWNEHDAIHIERMTRALWPWPGVFTTVSQKRLLLHEVRILSEHQDLAPGTLCMSSGNKPCIVTKDETLIELVRAGFAGSTMGSATDLLNGHRALFSQHVCAQ